MPNVGRIVEKVKLPVDDGDITEYSSEEAKRTAFWNTERQVVFVNGMKNTPANHAESAIALSLVQMCRVIGVYNKSSGALSDFMQCIGDKRQFNGPFTGNAGRLSEAQALEQLQRNPCQVPLFKLLRRPEARRWEVFAHSQGNLILSNVLQAIAAVDGPAALTGRIINTFGSPAVTWPPGVIKIEQGFTFDPVTWLAGFDTTFSISKLGWPTGERNPITHGFLFYLANDPAFVVNRFRWGGLGVTFNMDEDGLARCLAAMGTNLGRVRAIVAYLDKNHNSDADDVSVRYVALVRKNLAVLNKLKFDKQLKDLLIKTMAEGFTSSEEKAAIAFLRAL